MRQAIKKIKEILPKLHRLLFSLLIVFLPVQLGKHFWPPLAFVFGLAIDYLSPTIYLTDLLVLGILVSWGLTSSRFPKKLKLTLGLLLLGLFIIGSLLRAESWRLALYKWIKMGEFFLLGLYVAKNRSSLLAIRRWLIIPVLYSSLLALGQFLKRGSLNGLFWWLGERTFSLATPGIAKMTLAGRLVLRPYATFSHPNVLAGFLLVSLVLIVFEAKKGGFLFWPTLALALATVFLCFSRPVWLAGLIAAFFFAWTKRQDRPALFWWLTVLIVLSVFVLVNLPLKTSSVARRWDLIRAALLMIRKNPLLGVGLGSFITKLPFYWQGRSGLRFFQPVHNIFLLVAAEIGLVGLALFLGLFYRTIKKLSRERNLAILFSLLIVFMTGLFDHYWLTLQQGQLMFVLLLGLAWGKSRS